MRAHEFTTTPDPRLGAAFLAHFLPLCDLGDPPPVGAPKGNDRIRLEFLAAGYQLNVAFARRLVAGEDLSPEDQAALARELERCQQIRDDLEDRYAPYGVIGEATVVKGFVVNISFTFPDESRWFHEQRATLA